VAHVLTADPVDSLVELLAAEGVQASMDPAELNLPAVWVALDELARPTLGPVLELRTSLYLISPDTDARRSLGHLGQLHAKVLQVLTPDGPVTTQAVVLPGDPTPLPALRVPVHLYTEGTTP
jgi:hypothetical protein